MGRRTWLGVICLVVAGCSKKADVRADMVVRHANIHTMDDKNPRATALAVKGDKILWVGDEKKAA
ncbi:MAG: hypothetical protein M3P45_02245, partial [Acidobacteriota bacterium]|nr:hypothetical protein [Acidobacteriota bacterium]